MLEAEPPDGHHASVRDAARRRFFSVSRVGACRRWYIVRLTPLTAQVSRGPVQGIREIRAAHLAVGVDMDGIKHVLGIWVQQTEGAKFWS